MSVVIIGIVSSLLTPKNFCAVRYQGCQIGWRWTRNEMVVFKICGATLSLWPCIKVFCFSIIMERVPVSLLRKAYKCIGCCLICPFRVRAYRMLKMLQNFLNFCKRADLSKYCRGYQPSLLQFSHRHRNLRVAVNFFLTRFFASRRLTSGIFGISLLPRIL